LPFGKENPSIVCVNWKGRMDGQSKHTSRNLQDMRAEALRIQSRHEMFLPLSLGQVTEPAAGRILPPGNIRGSRKWISQDPHQRRGSMVPVSNRIKRIMTPQAKGVSGSLSPGTHLF
jgi:hypothetical protein